MTRGRPPLGPKIVQHLDGEADSKRRLEILLQSIAGSLSVPHACAQLGLSEARFFQLRSQILQGALDSMQPRPAGRPARTVEPKDQRIEQLEREVQLLHVFICSGNFPVITGLAKPGGVTWNKCDHFKETIRHELVHARHLCELEITPSRRLQNKCDECLCDEMRAYWYSGQCQGPSYWNPGIIAPGGQPLNPVDCLANSADRSNCQFEPACAFVPDREKRARQLLAQGTCVEFGGTFPTLPKPEQ